MKIHFIVLFLLIAGCANQTAPTGGPKDEDPPQLLSSNPLNQRTNVKSKEIELVFDELVKFNKAEEQIIISPRVSIEKDYRVKKNKAYIAFEETLPDSTTFTINFREGIQDLTEGNSPENLKLAFSTGDYLDSLFISGSIKDILTDKPGKNFSVFLYNTRDTLNIFEDKPLYFTKSDEEGQYKIENIKNGRYALYAVADKNKNLLLDMGEESYGFIEEPIVLDSSLNSVNILTARIDAKPLALKSARQNGTIYEIKYNKSLLEYRLVNQDSIKLFSNFTDNTNTVIQVFRNNINVDSTQTFIYATDSIGITSKDTVMVKFEETVRKPKEFQSKITLEKVFPSDGIIKGILSFNKPVSSYIFDSVYLFLDSMNIVSIDTTNHLSVNQYYDTFELDYTIDQSLFQTKTTDQSRPSGSKADSVKSSPPPKPHLYVGRGAFISVDQDSTNSKQTPLGFSEPSTTGTLLIEVVSEETHFIVQLLNTKFEVVQEQKNTKSFAFHKVSPGEYIVRVLVDKNKNGRWDPGNINESILPEPVFFYSNEEGNKQLTIRANWELGPNSIEF